MLWQFFGQIAVGFDEKTFPHDTFVLFERSEPVGIPTAASGEFRAPTARKSDDTAEKVQA
jgi:hypothetical protein